MLEVGCDVEGPRLVGGVGCDVEGPRLVTQVTLREKPSGVKFVNHEPSTATVVSSSPVFLFASQISNDASILFAGRSEFVHWEEISDGRFHGLVCAAIEYASTQKPEFQSIKMSLLKLVLRGNIRPGDVITSIATANEVVPSHFLSSMFLANLLVNEANYPVRLTLEHVVDGPYKIQSRLAYHWVHFNNNMFINSPIWDWDRFAGGFIHWQNLKHLSLCGNGIGRDGCASVATVLSGKSNLISIDLRDNRIDDQCVGMLAEALERNNILEIMVLENNPAITQSGWNRISTLVGDAASIEGTYCSNHTLRFVKKGLRGVGDPLVSGAWAIPPQGGASLLSDLLHINNRDSSSLPDRARRKVWRIHFSKQRFTLDQLLEYDTKLIPRVLAWLSSTCELVNRRVSVNFHSFKWLYHLIRNRNIPELFGRPSAESLRIGARIKSLESLLQQSKLEIGDLESSLQQLKLENEMLKANQSCSKRIRTN
jgi:hypothetical protein